MNFLIGGLSGMIATLCTQPVDFIKVQIQIRSEKGFKNLSSISIIKEVYNENKSIKCFYTGLDSAILRQAVYTSTRLGLFYSLTDYYTHKKGHKPTTLFNTFASLISGGVGGFVGNPTDLALIRMQSELNLPINQRKNYKNVFDVIRITIREEGILTLWRGSFPTVVRAMYINFSLLVPFEYMKSILQPYVLNFKLKIIYASIVSGAIASILSLPFDNIKTKLQKMRKEKEGIMPYKGVIDCFRKTYYNEGLLKLWVGLWIYYLRVAPYAIISFFTNDILRHIFKSNQI